MGPIITYKSLCMGNIKLRIIIKKNYSLKAKSIGPLDNEYFD